MMADQQKQEEPFTSLTLRGKGRGSEEETEQEENRELDVGYDDPGTPLPLTSRVLYIWQWLKSVRERTRYSFTRLNPMPPSAEELNHNSNPSSDPVRVKCLWDRLGEAAMMDFESSSFCWSKLSSLHHTQHSGSTEQSDDDTNRALEVTVNSGGVVFFALFNRPESDDPSLNEAAAVIKISSSRMATQSERLGYEFAKWLGIRVPQARIIHYTNPEWLQIKEAAEKAREAAVQEKDEVGEVTCSELLEALELSRCIFLMNYVHGSPLMENATAFDSREAAEKIASALGRILVLDLIIRNEDRLSCRQLGWRGNSANLLLADKSASANMDKLGEAYDSVSEYRPSLLRALQKSRRATSISSFGSQKSDLSEAPDSPTSIATIGSDIHVVTIDSGVPRRPPAGKRASDQENYPKLVELILNSSRYSSNLLHEITGGKLGSSSDADTGTVLSAADMAAVLAFRGGFRAAPRDLQGFHIFLLTLHQKLDIGC